MVLSHFRKITVLLLVLYWPTLFVLTHIPIPRVVRDADVSDKDLHFLAYLFLTFLLWFALHGDKKVSWRKASAWWMILLILWYGVIDELLQRLVTGRTCDVRDFFTDVAGTLTGLILFSIFTFWSAALIVIAILIFGATNVARANIAELLPVTRALFYLFAYAIFTALWLQFLECYWPGLRARGFAIRWILLALAVPTALLLTVKMTSLALGRIFIVRDMIISAMAIVAVTAAAYIIAVRGPCRVNRLDIP